MFTTKMYEKRRNGEIKGYKKVGLRIENTIVRIKYDGGFSIRRFTIIPVYDVLNSL